MFFFYSLENLNYKWFFKFLKYKIKWYLFLHVQLENEEQCYIDNLKLKFDTLKNLKLVNRVSIKKS